MTIWTNGTFDVIHIGHINLLLFCRGLAGESGRVVISLDTDEKIKNDKGVARPIFSLKQRQEAINSLFNFNKKVVDITLSHQSNEVLHSLIKATRPDYIVVGDDYKNKNVVGSDLAEVIFMTKNCMPSTQIIEACQRKKS